VGVDENLLSIPSTSSRRFLLGLACLTNDLLQSFDRARMSATSLTSTDTLGADLERDRLTRRVRRMTVTISVLRQRERENRRWSGAPRRHLGRVIADFEAQIQTMNLRLHDLGVDGPPIQIPREGDGHRC
jgi:hypothetical protein